MADAIGRDKPQEIEAELGDLLFQVVFHAQMGAERGWFNFASRTAPGKNTRRANGPRGPNRP